MWLRFREFLLLNILAVAASPVCGQISPVMCSEVHPSLEEPERHGKIVGEKFGVVVPAVRQEAEFTRCRQGAQWCVAVRKYVEEHSLAIDSQGRVDVPDASAPIVSPTTCLEILEDLKPPGPGERRGPSRREYWSRSITEHHERAHVQNFSLFVTHLTFRELQNLTSVPDLCADRDEPIDPDLFDEELRDLVIVNVRAMMPLEEVRAHSVSNPEYQELRTAIRERARGAPPEENWPEECK